MLILKETPLGNVLRFLKYWVAAPSCLCLRCVCARPPLSPETDAVAAKCADSPQRFADHHNLPSSTDKPVQSFDDEGDKAPYKMIQTIGLSVGAAVAYIIVVLGLMFYCKKRRHAKRLQKGQDGEEPEMECLNGGFQGGWGGGVGGRGAFCGQPLSQTARDRRRLDGNLLPPCGCIWY